MSKSFTDFFNDQVAFQKEVNEKFGYNAKDLWLYLDRIKTFEAVEDMGFLIRELYDYANMMKTLNLQYQ